MKKIIQIAKTEILLMFYSPIAWIVIAAFFIQVGVKYIYLLEWVHVRQSQGMELLRVSNLIYSSVRAGTLFRYIGENLFLYFPLITMPLFSKEFSSGSYKLLQSSPISTLEIVIGKYLSMVSFSFIFCLYLIVLWQFGFHVVEGFESSRVLVGILGLFLIMCVYASLGLFISSLTTYQVVAAISTFASIFVLDNIGNWQQATPYINELFYWLSTKVRLYPFLQGVVYTDNFIYYILVIFLFLTFTFLKLSSNRWLNIGSRKLILGVALFIIVSILGVVSSSPRLVLEFDFTSNKTNSLNDSEVAILDKIGDKPIRLVNYINILSNKLSDGSGLPHQRIRSERRLRQIEMRIPQLDFEYVYFYDTIPNNSDIYRMNPGKSTAEIARIIADTYRLDFNSILNPNEIKNLINLTEEDNEFVQVFYFEGKKRVVRFFDDPGVRPTKPEYFAALKTLVDRPYVITFTKGHGERSFSRRGSDYRLVFLSRFINRNSLKNQGFDFVDWEELTLEPALPDIVVSLDPRRDFSPEEIFLLEEFISRGVSFMFLFEPDSKTNLKKLLSKELKVGFGDTELLSTENKQYDKNFIFADLTFFTETIDPTTYNRYLFRVGSPNIMVGSGSIKHDSVVAFSKHPFVTVDDNSIQNPQDSLPYEVLVLGLSNRSNSKQRFIISNEADVFTNKEFNRVDIRSANKHIFPDLIAWLTNGEFPMRNKFILPPDNRLLIGQRQINRLEYILVYILPFILVVGGGTVLMIRRRK